MHETGTGLACGHAVELAFALGVVAAARALCGVVAMACFKAALGMRNGNRLFFVMMVVVVVVECISTDIIINVFNK